MAAAAAVYDQHHPQEHRPPLPPPPAPAVHHRPSPSTAEPTTSESPPRANGEVFTCIVCLKEFEKRTSCDRHTRRCRKKRPEDIIPRKKSCNHCANSKARCDQRRPQCTRCRTKGLSGCEYAYQQPSPSEQHQQLHQHVEPLPHTQQLNLEFTDLLLLGDVDMNIAGDFFSWGECARAQHSQQLATRRPSSPQLFSPSSNDTLQINTPSLTVGHSSSSDSPNSSTYDFDLCTAVNMPTAESQFRPGTPSSHNLVLMRQPTMQLPPNAYPQVELVSRMLSTFPAMLKKPKTAPPFIHKQRLLPGKCPEAIANVTALVHLTSVKSPDNKAFVSSMIQAEWERLHKTMSMHLDLNEWTKVETFQAMVVLAIVRLFEGDFELKDVNVLEECGANIGFCGLFTSDTAVREEEEWEPWILRESKRRTFVTTFLLDRLFHYRKGMMPIQCRGLGDIQLPASRNVWEAETAEDWEEQNVTVRSFPGWEGKRSEWVTLRELWEGSTRMGAFYTGVDALTTCLLADAVVATGEGFKIDRDLQLMQ